MLYVMPVPEDALPLNASPSTGFWARTFERLRNLLRRNPRATPQSSEPGRGDTVRFQLLGEGRPTVDGEGPALALLELGIERSSELIKRLDEQLLATGRPFRTGGTLGTACLPLAAGGAAMTSSLAAGNVFLAFEPAAWLMQAKAGGVYSAVTMGGGQIVRQARFFPVSGALLPVVTPILLFNAFSSMLTATRFAEIERELKHISGLLRQQLRRSIQEDLARYLSSIERLEDLSEEHRSAAIFTEEMKMRLVLIERDVNVLRYKHEGLARAAVDSVLDARISTVDRNLFVASSIADAQVDYMRLRLALQDNPPDAERTLKRLMEKIRKYESDFNKLAESDPIAGYEQRLRESASKMKRWTKFLPWRPETKGEKELKELAALKSEQNRPGVSRIAHGADLRTPPVAPESSDSGPYPDDDYLIVFWQERGGSGQIRAFYTADIQLDRHPESVSVTL